MIDHSGHQRGEAGVALDQRDQEGTQREAHRSSRDDQLGSEARVETSGHERGDGEHGHHRQQTRPRLQRAVAEDLLEELGQEEQRREEDRRHHQRRDARRAEVGVAHHVPRYERPRSGPPLVDRKGHEQQNAEREQPEDARIAPTPVGHLVEGHEQRDQADRQAGDARVVDALAPGVGFRFVDRAPGGEAGERGNGQVEVHDRPPAQRLGERAAEKRSGRVAETGHTDDQTARQPRLVLGQDVVGHAQRRRPHDRAPDAHQRPAGDQPELVLCRTAQNREEREDRGPDEEEPSASEHVGQTPAGHDQHTKDQRVGVDHPLHGGHVGVEVALDVRQRHAQRCDVVGDDEHRQRHGTQGEQSRAVEPGHRTGTLHPRPEDGQSESSSSGSAFLMSSATRCLKGLSLS